MALRTQGYYKAADGSMRPSWGAGSSQSGSTRTGSVAQASLATANQGSSKLYRYTCCAVCVAGYVTALALAFFVGFYAGERSVEETDLKECYEDLAFVRKTLS